MRKGGIAAGINRALFRAMAARDRFGADIVLPVLLP